MNLETTASNGKAPLRAQLKTWWNSNSPMGRRLHFAVFAVVLLILEVLLYRNYIFGDKYLIYVGVGADSWAQSVPFFLSASSKFSSFDFSTWNFSQFLGAQMPQALNPEYIVSVFGKDNVAPMMLIVQIAKSYLAGVFFYFYAYYLGARYEVRFVSALGVAFCARMIALSAWTGYTMEVTLAIALMWAFERFLANQRRFVALPIVFAALIAALSIYGLILYSFVMLVYVTVRLGYGGHGIDGARAIALFSGKLLGLYAFGICIAAVILFPYAECYMSSARVSSTAVDLSSLASISSPDILATQYLSMFATGIFGTENNHTGIVNVLNSPYYYCGVLAVLAAPFAFFGKTKRQRAWLAITALVAGVYIAFTGFRFALNGFNLEGNDFRASSFWITIILAYFGVLGLNELWRKQHRRAIVIVFVAEIALLALSWIAVGEHAWKRPACIAVVALAAFCIAFAFRKPTEPAVSAFIILVACAELLLQANPVVNQVPFVTHDQYASVYNEAFPEEMDDIDGADDGLYRIDYPTTLLARPMAQDYKGTQAYIGGTGLTQEQIDFLKSVYPNDYIATLGYSRYAYGFNDMSLNTLLGVRYRIPKEGSESPYIPFGYSQASDEDDPFPVYENGYSLPLMISYAYDEAISASQLESLPREDRGYALLETCVVPDELPHSGSVSEPVLENAPVIAHSADRRSELDEPITVRFAGVESQHLLASVDLSCTSHESGNVMIDISFEKEDGTKTTCTYYTAGGNERIRVPIENDGYVAVSVAIQSVNLCDDATIQNLTVRALPDQYIEGYVAAISDKLNEGPETTVVDNSTVSGHITMADDGFIATSIPWSNSWQAFVDGKQTETFRVNYGFVGVQAPSGYHEITLLYRDKGQIAGAIISGIALAILAILAVVSGGRRKAETLDANQQSECVHVA